jgi:predicted amino acid-binding ACT domain protein
VDSQTTSSETTEAVGPRPSISSLVSSLLKNDPTLVHELQRRDKSQRHVAKQLRRAIQEKYEHLAPAAEEGEEPWPKEGAVAVAITRYLKDLRRKQEDPQRVAEVLQKGTTNIDDGMRHYLITLDADDGLGSDILWGLYQKTVERDLSGVQLTEKGVEVYVKKLSEEKFLKSVERANIQKIRDSELSHLKLLLPKIAAEVPGVLAHVGTLLADQGISIIDVLVHHQSDFISLVFVVSEKHAARGREVLMKVINAGSRH